MLYVFLIVIKLIQLCYSSIQKLRLYYKLQKKKKITNLVYVHNFQSIKRTLKLKLLTVDTYWYDDMKSLNRRDRLKVMI